MNSAEVPQVRTNSPIGPADYWAMVGLVGYTFGIAAWLWANNIHVTMDDGFYYFKIAQNIAQGHGSSFDGLTQTNGYHPLWLVCLVPIFFLAPDIHAALFLGTALQACFMAGGVCLVYLTARRLGHRSIAVPAALVWIWLTHRVYLGGLEFSLHALGVLATAYVYVRWFSRAKAPPTAYYLLLGLLSGLTFLARLDTILLSGILGAALVWKDRHSGFNWDTVSRLVAYAVPILGSVLVYGVVSLSLFGTPLTVSSAVKRSWSAELLSQDSYYQTYGWWVAKLIHGIRKIRAPGVYTTGMLLGSFGGAMILLLSAWTRWRPSSGDGWRCIFARTVGRFQPFVIYSVLSYLSFVAIYHGGYSFSPWYYVAQPWVGVMGMSAAVAGFFQLPRCLPRFRLRILRPHGLRLMTILLAGAIVVGQFSSLHSWKEKERTGAIPLPLHAAAEWIRENLPEDVILGAWNAGASGYLSERRVINLDGLVNSWDFYESAQWDLCAYWDTMNIRYLVDLFSKQRPKRKIGPNAPYRFYADCGERLDLIWEDPQFDPYWWSLQVYRLRPAHPPHLSNPLGSSGK